MLLRTTTVAAFVATAQVLAATPSIADPVTYNLSATLSGGAQVTGNFTLNNGSLAGFDFTLPVAVLPDPVFSELKGVIPGNGVYIEIDQSPNFFQILAQEYDPARANVFQTYLNFSFNSLPTGSTPVSLRGGSDIQQAAYGGSQWDYMGFFQSSTITLAAAPAPGPVVGAGLPGLIFAGGSLVVLWRRKRTSAAALSA